MEAKLKYLEMIQEVINRMACNSFTLKSWTVTLVAGIFALSARDSEKFYFLITYIPVVVFWGLDSYYLMQEKLYRRLYTKVAEVTEDKVDFNMNINLDEFKTKKTTWKYCLMSITELGFYFPLAFVCAFVIILALLF